ncbi:NUDIX domain-containing protein [Actinosynnema sp. NPDC023587]|uniref:NUDIX hydrolase n=1 Tax=Actinosynnema sp. NPDC023587 TaxID=3154695 RepID=UPI0033CBEAE4
MSHRVTFGDGEYRLTWVPGEVPPRDHPVVQASAVCFTGHRQVVLISTDASSWGLPGGHLEPGETPEVAMCREVWEEATAEVLHAVYLGASHVHRLDADEPDFYQTRFWAHVRLREFRPSREARHRRVFDVDELERRLNWTTRDVAARLAEAARGADGDYDYEGGRWTNRRPAWTSGPYPRTTDR